jgi:hypothetical protein
MCTLMCKEHEELRICDEAETVQFHLLTALIAIEEVRPPPVTHISSCHISRLVPMRQTKTLDTAWGDVRWRLQKLLHPPPQDEILRPGPSTPVHSCTANPPTEE